MTGGASWDVGADDRDIGADDRNDFLSLWESGQKMLKMDLTLTKAETAAAVSFGKQPFRV
ncbi:hypothetical protein VN24_16410 [Paenibacillus beijingensis]|uniref:Uncharacterized protein n=1 Tax=Paenibacillus beijingensis TaxID=1126833 RepID=A0A0D5NKH1_9BACL|nr:hypothetical protein VN24_16410 [Paenibacillus beijingensis]